MGAIAIVGAACRLPGAENLAAFWSLLDRGGDAVTEVPADRFTHARFLHPKGPNGATEAGTSYTFAAGIVDGIDQFDPAAFGLSPREAQEMDPQQRLLLEVTRAAIEDAGWSANGLSGSQTGVFVGASSTDFWANRYQDVAAVDRYGMTGGAMSIIANRLAHVFDLRGAAQTIDTACSSSLVALHLACEELRSGRLSAALVGGVNMLLAPFPFIGFSRASMLSPTGRCHAFSGDADGYVRAEGAGVVLVKRLEDALADGDTIRAVIRGTGTNSAGRTVGLSLPNSDAQAELLRHVLERSGLSPAQFGYFEAHGTGTLVGDPAEAAAISAAIAGRCERAAGGALAIGSVKTNIGHLESASGMAGLLKAMLVLQHRQIPASLHCTVPNAAIPFETMRLEIANAARPLATDDDVAVGVNSFGFGGTNGTVFLTSAPAPAPQRPRRLADALPQLLLSAHAQPALRGLAELWETRLAEISDAELPSLLRSAARQRDLQPHRLVVRGTDRDTLQQALRGWLAGETQTSIATEGTAARTTANRDGVVFVFAGNGAQMAGMAQQAVRHNPHFRAALTKVDAALAPLLGWSPKKRIVAGVTAEDLLGTDLAQPLLFATQVAIVETLRASGINADACLGHSVGEVAAAWAAGLLDLPTAAKLIVIRSSQQHRLRGQGKMAALGCGIEDALPALAEASAGLPGPALEVAAENGPRAITVAGPEAMLARLGDIAEARRWSYLALDLDYAFHSAAMDPVAGALVRELADMKVHPAQARMISTVTTTVLDAAGCTPDYWWHNLRDRVRFRGAVHTAAAGARLFVEIGGTPILQSYLRETLQAAGSEARMVVTLSRRDPPGDPFPAIIDRAIAQGADPRAAAVFRGPSTPSGLPLTPFNRVTVKLAKTTDAITIIAPLNDHPLLGFRAVEHPNEWVRRVDTGLDPWLADHCFAGAAILPAAAMAEMALAAAALHWPDAAVLEVTELRLLRMLPIPEGRGQDMRLRRQDDGRISLASRPHLSDEAWTDHAVGQIGALATIPTPEPSDFVARRSVSGAEIIALAAAIGLDYGPAFQPVVSADLDPDHDRAIIHLTLPASAPSDDGFLLHPVRLDGALQGLIALLSEGASGFLGAGMVPSQIGRMLVRRGAPAPVTAEIHVRRRGTRSVVADIVLRDAVGMVVARAWDCWMQRVPLAHGSAAADPAFRFDLLPAITAAQSVDGLADAAMQAVLAAPAAVDAGHDAMAEAAELLRGCILAAAFAAFAGQDIKPLRTAYARALMAALVETGFAETDAASASGWRLVADADLPAAGEIWRAVYADHSDLAPELAWIAAAIERLPDVLGSTGWGDDGTTDPSHGAVLPAEAGSNRRIGDALIAAAIQFADAWPVEIPLRVLDFGGRGDIAAAIATTGRRVVHVAVQMAGEPNERATSRSGSALQAGAVETVKLVWDPSTEGAKLPASDLVVGIGTGLRFGPGLLPAVQGALADGGALLLVEPTAGLGWIFVSGQDASWWDGLGADGAGLLDGDEWTRMLEAQGFTGIAVRDLPGLVLPAALVMAQIPSKAEIASDDAPRSDGSQIVLLARPGALRNALQAGFAAEDWPCRVLDFNTRPDPEMLRGRIVIALPPTDLGAGPGLPRALAAITDIALACADRAEAMVLVTEGGLQPNAGPHVPAAAACLGMARVLANECAPLRLRRIDLCPGLAPAQTADRLIAELLGPDDGEAEIALTATGRMVPRLRHGLPSAPQSGPRHLIIGNPGQLGTLAWAPIAMPEPALQSGELRLRVEATGLNFRDVMWAQALLPEDVLMDGFAGPTLGMEAAGTVIAVGPGVDFAVGDAVFGFVAGSFASRAVVHAGAVTKRPDRLTPSQAATIPVTFMTAVYALENCARLQSGERVLIHAGTGGVGLAAIQVAKAAGAAIAATAGTPAKRALLRQLGVDLVLDSRDLGFADALREVWPDGVDVVLNSLAGGFMDRSLALVRPFGRFVEIGKRDFVENRFTSLRPLRQNVTYFAVDVDQLPRARPDIAARMLADISARMQDGSLQPLPATVFGHHDVEAAFRMLQAATHMGKIVVVPPHDAPASFVAGADLSGRGTVVIIGGVQGFGLATARFLALQGVKHLALISRQGAATAGAVAALGELAGLGTTARAYGCDAADANALAATLATIRAEQPPIIGIIHAAAVLDDGAASSMTTARFAPVLAAKLAIAENLDRLTADDDLAYFVMYSSATTALGNPGQANYVAANAALEGLARRRRAAGRPALAVGWGPIADVGILARDADTAGTLKRRMGATAMPAREALAALPGLLAQSAMPGGVAVAHYARLDWSQLGGVLPVLAEKSFSVLRDGAPSNALGGRDMLERLRAVPAAEAAAMLRGMVREEVARILQLGVGNAGDLALDVPLPRLGLDSLGGMELRGALEARLGIPVPLASVSDTLTIEALVLRIRDAALGQANDTALHVAMERHEGKVAAEAASAQHVEAGQ